MEIGNYCGSRIRIPITTNSDPWTEHNLQGPKTDTTNICIFIAGTSGFTRVHGAFSADWGRTWWGWPPPGPSTSGATPPPRRGSTAAYPSPTGTRLLYTWCPLLLQVQITQGLLALLSVQGGTAVANLSASKKGCCGSGAAFIFRIQEGEN